MDDADEQKADNEKVLRCREMCHLKDIISGDYAHNLQMIATGSRDHVVRIWDYEKFRLVNQLRAHEDEVTTVRFLKPLPLLLTADCKGIMYIWLIPPHKDGRKCLLKWTNKHSMESDVPISAVDSYYNPVDETLLLLIGDEKGYVKVSDITACVRHYNLKPMDQVTAAEDKRNPYFTFKADQFNKVDERDDDNDKAYTPELDDGNIKQ